MKMKIIENRTKKMYYLVDVVTGTLLFESENVETVKKIYKRLKTESEYLNV
jgi:hypothetical protein